MTEYELISLLQTQINTIGVEIMDYFTVLTAFLVAGYVAAAPTNAIDGVICHRHVRGERSLLRRKRYGRLRGDEGHDGRAAQACRHGNKFSLGAQSAAVTLSGRYHFRCRSVHDVVWNSGRRVFLLPESPP